MLGLILTSMSGLNRPKYWSKKIELGDSINRFTLLQKLKVFAQSRPELLNAYLEARIPLHPDSSIGRRCHAWIATLASGLLM